MSAPGPVFAKVSPELDFPKEERETLAFWRENRIFEKSLEANPDGPTFVFYEGPPTANGMPHNGHVLTRVVKDLFPRYKTMRGYKVPRKAGWDTHGLPVEVEVEKELRIHGKAAIEAYGMEPFVRRCIDSVFRYTDEWARLTERVGFWVDLPDAYVTFHKSYVESVWWALSELFKKGLLYQGHKVVWWWAQGGTALSAAEVGQGYKEVDDPSVYVAFPLESDPSVSLLVWTTTPWTLPSNMYAAINPNFEYVVVSDGSRKFVVAKGLVEALAKKFKTEFTVERTVAGAELVGKNYGAPFDAYFGVRGNVTTKSGDTLRAFHRIVAADFVTLDAGTGIVHVAPAFGQDDHAAHMREVSRVASGEIPLVCAVNPDGTFTNDVPKYQGRWVKDCDKDIQAELKERGILVFAETYRHDYPFCWRADSDPLIQFARPAWYIRTTEKIDRAIANNETIQWMPPHIGDGRFGDFLANNVDWALSRERFWGTPLNVWINDETGAMEAPDSVAAILAKNPKAFDHFHEAKKKDPTLSEHLLVHKPWIDSVTWQNPGEKGTYRRVPEVIDCWFDSGCMPFAQWGFPHQGREKFLESFPADFISEAIDQTRGWFYSLLMVSTLLFDADCQKRLAMPAPVSPPHPYKTCIVLGHISDKEGKKESKSKGNYTPPEVILDRVRMEFAVLDPKDAPGVEAKSGVAFIGREDLEGLDVAEGATVKLYVGENGAPKDFVLKVAKKLRRRVVVLDPADRAALGAVPTKTVDVKPVEVPRLPENERVYVDDVATPAPGADAFRWFFYASNPPWNATRHSLSNVRTLQKDFLVKLRNVYSFFTIYANIDGFDPYANDTLVSSSNAKSELDAWLESELATTTAGVVADLDGYDLYAATQKLGAFCESLSNWYVRRSRERFWRGGRLEADADKRAAYATLHGALVTFAKLVAPFVPFASEAMYRNLVVGPAKRAGVVVPESVHLARYPVPNRAHEDVRLSRKMEAVRELVSLGLQVRTQHKLKVRQPLRAAHVILTNAALADDLAKAERMIRDELNVLEVKFVATADARSFVDYRVKPNFRTLGQRGLGKEAQMLKKAMADASADEAARIHGELLAHGKATAFGVDLLPEDVEIAFDTKEGFAAAGGRIGVVVIETALDEELRSLGLVREVQNRIQTERKELGLEYTDRIALTIVASDRVIGILKKHQTDLAREVLATTVAMENADTVSGDPTARGLRPLEVEGEALHVGVARSNP